MNTPHVSCPGCWWPIPIQNSKQTGEYACTNRSCLYNSVKIRIFTAEEDAHNDRIQCGALPNKVFIGTVKQLYDINESPTQFWGYFFCEGPLARFRLLSGFPLINLLPQDLIADWSHGIAERANIPFNIFLLEHERSTGEIVCDPKSGDPILVPIRVDKRNQHLSSPVKYCSACTLVRENYLTAKAKDPELVDPCKICNQRLAGGLLKYLRSNSQSARLAAIDPTTPATDLFLNAFHLCWLGLVDVTFPIYVADVVVALAFSGQRATTDLQLSTEQLQTRADILSRLSVSEESIHDCMAKVPSQTIEQIEANLWQTVRLNAHVIQMLAESRYGQLGTARADLLSNELRRTAFIPISAPLTKWTVLSQLASLALEKLSEFFSFRRAALLLAEGGKWHVTATFPKRTKLGEEIKNASNQGDTQLHNPASFDQLVQLLWPGQEIAKPVYSVRVDENYLYIFTDRRHKNNQPRKCFNQFSQNLFHECAHVFHQALFAQLSIYERIDNIRGIVHNLGGPMAEIESALAKLDDNLYNNHLQEMLALPSRYDFIRKAFDRLSSDIGRSKRRVAFEVQKFQRGSDLTPYLGKPRRNVLVRADVENNPVSGSGFWNMALWSLDMYSHEMRARNIRLDQKFDPKDMDDRAFDYFVRIDKDALQLVIDNVIDNAVKYAYDDSSLRIHIFRDKKNGESHCALWVTNFGNGILREELERVWERFFRGSYSSTRRQKVPGTGLGLYIVRTIIEDYNGNVSITSDFGGDTNFNVGEGYCTTVVIRLPLHKKALERK